MSVSPKFDKFAKKNHDKFDEARKQESMAQGCPVPVGTIGIAIVGKVEAKETQKGDPIVMLTLEVESPDEYSGKKITGPGLMQTIKASEKQTEDQAWARMLDMLEQAGLPREVREGYEDFAECIDWFNEAPRRVEYTVRADNYAGNRSGKTVNITALVDEANIPTSEGLVKQPETTASDPAAAAAEAGTEFCMYQNVKHAVVKVEGEMATIKSTKTNRVREGVPVSQITFLD